MSMIFSNTLIKNSCYNKYALLSSKLVELTEKRYNIHMDQYTIDEIEEFGIEDGTFDKDNKMPYESSFGSSVDLTDLTDELGCYVEVKPAHTSEGRPGFDY